LKKAISEDKDLGFLKEESAAVKDATSKSTFRKYKAVYNESKFISKKDELLQYAVEQRYKKDARLRKILEAARRSGRITTGEAEELTGAPRPTVKTRLSELVKRGLLKPQGQGRGAWYGLP
jgi:predicted HTH transcriptional regulator